MSMKSHRDLDVWKRSVELVRKVNKTIKLISKKKQAFYNTIYISKMLLRSSHHSRIAQIIDVCTAFMSFIAAYYLSLFLYNIAPSHFPPKVEIKDSYYALIIILSFIYKILFDQQNAYSFQRFTSLLREYTIVQKVCFTGFLINIAIAYFF